MTDAEHDSAAWIRELVAGNDQVVREFVERYGPSLERIAAGRMTPGLKRRVGPDDILQSVCRTFVRRARAGEFTLPDSEQLWRLLCAITLTKVRQHARFHFTPKRNLAHEEDIALVAGRGAAAGREPVDPSPTPEEAAEFADGLGHLVDSLGAEEGQIVRLKLEGYSHAEIADQLGCAERTIGRLLKNVKVRLESILQDSGC